MKNSFHRLIKNIEKLQKLPLTRYNWEIEMSVLNLDCEICNFVSKYEKDTFYKLTNESRNSTLFDYFIKLKPKPPPTICIGTGEHKKVLKDKLKELKEEEKKILIRFE